MTNIDIGGSRGTNGRATANRRWWTLAAVSTGVFMRAAFIEGLNSILLIGAALAFAAAVVSFVLIRERDFVVVNVDQEDNETPGLAVAA